MNNKKIYKIGYTTMLTLEVYAENQQEALELALGSPLSDWAIIPLSEPIVKQVTIQ